MLKLAEKKCVPCEGGTKPLGFFEVSEFRKQLSKTWEITGNKLMKHKFKFSEYRKAVEFVDKVAALAIEQDHHPQIELFYDMVVIKLTTHAIGGLSENDFIMASKIEQI